MPDIILFGTSIGTMCSGAISQIFYSRRKAVALYLLIGALVSANYLMLGPQFKMPVELFYALYFVLGCMGGGWLMITLIACEHFGTNIRATTAITVANLLRGLTIPMIFMFQFLQTQMSITNAAALIGIVLYICAFPALRYLRETYGLDLDYVERLEKRSKI